MDSVTLATLCTQDIILGMVDKKGLDRDGFAKSIGEDDISRWDSEPVLTYEGFLRSCSVLGKGVNATRLFEETRKRLVGGWRPGKTKSGLSKSRDILGRNYVDAEKAGMDAADALIMDWDAVLEAIAKGTKKDIEVVRACFDQPPTKNGGNNVFIHTVKHGEENERAIGRLIRSGMAAARIKGGDALEMEFPDQ